ncbi:MAG: DUF1992 domain-containing protein [Desulfobacteraceae bacterium]|nr:DUF1992 domain-containing protein [Desulfobacteraceae bacterium]
MLHGFDKIVEERIQKAIRQGDLDNLDGHGKPLVFEDDSNIAEELRLAYKILKNADFIPPEIELRKEIRQTEELLADMPDTAEKYRAMKKLNFLIMKLNSMRDTPVSLEMPQRYMERMTDRFESKKSAGKRK